MTGATFFTTLLGAKRLGLLHELVPKAEVIALLINQNSSQGQAKDVQEAARDLGQRVVVLNGGSDADIDAAFASLAQHQAGALAGASGKLSSTLLPISLVLKEVLKWPSPRCRLCQ